MKGKQQNHTPTNETAKTGPGSKREWPTYTHNQHSTDRRSPRRRKGHVAPSSRIRGRQLADARDGRPSPRRILRETAGRAQAGGTSQGWRRLRTRAGAGDGQMNGNDCHTSIASTHTNSGLPTKALLRKRHRATPRSPRGQERATLNSIPGQAEDQQKVP